jgi:hypothetical protein
MFGDNRKSQPNEQNRLPSKNISAIWKTGIGRHLFGSMTWGTNLTAVDVADQVTNRPFLVASDGASDPKTWRATFGWLLIDPTGNIMVQCAGPVYVQYADFKCKLIIKIIN